MSTISDTTTTMIPGAAATVDISALAEKPSGLWPVGWYGAEIIEGYTTRSGKVFRTETVASNKGDSYNFIVCFRMSYNGEERTTFAQINYRPSDFTTERIETVRRLREEFAGQKGSWGPQFKDQQASSMALAKLGQLQTACGVSGLGFDETGRILASPFLGKKPFVHLTIDEESGYNEINRFSLYPSGVAPKSKSVKSKS